MLKHLIPIVSLALISFPCNIATAQERFVSVSESNNLLVDSKDIFIQDHLDPAVRVARVLSVNSEGNISNVFLTWVDCQANTSGLSLVTNGKGEIVYMAGDKMDMAEQAPGTQAYKTIRTICELPARSGSQTSEKVKAEPRWMAVPGTADSKSNPTLHVDQDSIGNVRGALNFDVVDVEGNSYHTVAICSPANPKYGQIAFTTMNGVSLTSNLSKPKPGSKTASLFKFACSKYGYLKHGEGYRRSSTR